MIKPYSLERETFVKRTDRIFFAVRNVWAEMFDFEGDAVGPLVMSFYVKYSRATHNI
jgi:hypothetical protein